MPQAELIAVDGAKHLWVGEPYVRIVLNEIVRRVNPRRRAAAHRVEGLTVPLFDLTGKNAFVTGASRGIGQVIAVALAGAGADVALVARSEDGLADTAAQVTALGRKAFVIPADVTEQESVAAAVATAIDQLGCLDIVVNNAGGSSFMVPFLDLRLTGWDKLIRLNLDSAMYVCHAFGRHLVERGTGSVINVASVAGVSAAPFLAPYGAAKAGLVSLTKSLAVEWAALGVRVNALCPGWTATELNRNLWADETAGPATVATVPMRRWAQAGGDGRCGRVPGQRGVLVHDRPGPGRRRRPDRDGLTGPEHDGLTADGAAPYATARPALRCGQCLLGPPLVVVGLGLGRDRLLGRGLLRLDLAGRRLAGAGRPGSPRGDAGARARPGCGAAWAAA